jgi:hypothetical protein
MKKKLTMTLFIGAVLGSVLAFVYMWLWQTLTGNISMIAIVFMIIAAGGVFLFCKSKSRKEIQKLKKTNEKNKSYYDLLSSWMVLRNKGRILAEYFDERNLKNVAIYGLERVGLCLYEELKNSNINVKYAIDTDSAHFSYLDLTVVAPEDQLEMVDVIVVTPFLDYQEIVKELQGKTSCQVVSLKDLISSI